MNSMETKIENVLSRSLHVYTSAMMAVFAAAMTTKPTHTNAPLDSLTIAILTTVAHSCWIPVVVLYVYIFFLFLFSFEFVRPIVVIAALCMLLLWLVVASCHKIHGNIQAVKIGILIGE